MTVRAMIRLTMLRGEIIAKDNQFCGKRGYGTLLHRSAMKDNLDH